VPRELLHPGLSVLDLVYRPDPTRLVREARLVGATAETGAGILLGQAWRSLELWLGRPAPVAVMAAALERELGRTEGTVADGHALTAPSPTGTEVQIHG
jgi:shikimate dehydrogenase